MTSRPGGRIGHHRFVCRNSRPVAEMVRKELKRRLQVWKAGQGVGPRAKPDEPKVDAQRDGIARTGTEEPVEEEAFEEEEVALGST